jgi:hypothetical protein
MISSTSLPSYFPLTPKECKEIATPFFSCFSKESEYGSFNTPKKALEICSSNGQLQAYITCAEKYLTTKQKSTWSAPHSYLIQTNETAKQ